MRLIGIIQNRDSPTGFRTFTKLSTPPRLSIFNCSAISRPTPRSVQAVVQAAQAGASGYLLKSAEPEFLLAAIRTVHSGYSVIAPGSIHSLFEHAARNVPAAGPDLSVLNVLSVRERDVFLLAAKGLSNGEMAESLFVSEATIKTHQRSVLDKLELRTWLQLVAFAHERRPLGT